MGKARFRREKVFMLRFLINISKDNHGFFDFPPPVLRRLTSTLCILISLFICCSRSENFQGFCIRRPSRAAVPIRSKIRGGSVKIYIEHRGGLERNASIERDNICSRPSRLGSRCHFRLGLLLLQVHRRLAAFLVEVKYQISLHRQYCRTRPSLR